MKRLALGIGAVAIASGIAWLGVLVEERARPSEHREEQLAPARVRMSSREGFTLPFVELEQPNGTWKHVSLDESQELDGSELEQAALVRGPGHVPVVVDRFRREIVLDVDALLVIESDSPTKPNGIH